MVLVRIRHEIVPTKKRVFGSGWLPRYVESYPIEQRLQAISPSDEDEQANHIQRYRKMLNRLLLDGAFCWIYNDDWHKTGGLQRKVHERRVSTSTRAIRKRHEFN